MLKMFALACALTTSALATEALNGPAAGWLERARGVTAPPSPRSQPAEVPADLVAAGALWSREAQQAKLFAAHPTPKESFRFAVIGDVEPGRFPWQRIFAPKGAFRALLSLLQNESPDFMVQLGDFVSEGNASNYRKLLDLLSRELRVPMVSVIGNHDRSRPNGEADKSFYLAIFGAGDHFFDYNGYRFIALDTSDRRLTAAQLAWLETALDTGLQKLIFLHVPPGYLRKRIESLGGALMPEDKQFNMSGYFDEGSSEFGVLVARARVLRVYMGHIHAFGQAEKDGVRYVLTAGGGSPHYPLPPGYPKQKMAHYVSVTAGPAGVRETVRLLDGTSFDLP